VAAEDFLVDEGRYGEAIETVGERLPQFYGKSSFAYKKDSR